MTRRQIVINPISRVEGHGKVTLHLDEGGRVEDARFHVLQFRGFEAFCRGRPYEEMPIITQRICGICPVSHQLASAKACDAVMGVEIPPAAALLRELIHMGQFIQSHALHFFYLASPDFLLGWDADPAERNVVGVISKFPQLAVKGVRLRKFGQEIIKALGGKKVHPAFSVRAASPIPWRGRTGTACSAASRKLTPPATRPWSFSGAGSNRTWMKCAVSPTSNPTTPAWSTGTAA